MSDQHRADVVGYEGNTVVRTPVLDELARTGVVFRNAYTPSPVCVPGRQCMMSGQLPKTCGCEGWVDLKPGYMTFARRFSQYAYNTVCSGKLHHLDFDQMQGWTTRVAPDTTVSEAYLEGAITSEFDLYPKPSDGTGKWSNQKEIERAGIGYGPYQEFDRIAVDAVERYSRRYFSDPWYDRPSGLRPLLLKLSLLQPHYPFFTDEEKFLYYLNRVPLYLEDPCDHPVLSKSQQGKPVSASERDIRRATAAYYGMIETVDSHLGETLETLEREVANLDDWIIVYTSDHGEMLGEHGIWEKTRFYEGSVRVPFIVRWPKHFDGGRIVDENVNLCDLFSTLCDLAGLETPSGLDSRSLVPLMSGKSDGWRDESVSQMGMQHVMIKQGTMKYQYYGESVPEVLFDLSSDPGERVNLADRPDSAEILDSFRSRLSVLGHGSDPIDGYVNAGYTDL
jgi:choline-sulfatase